MYKVKLVTIITLCLVCAQFICTHDSVFSQGQNDQKNKLAISIAIKQNSTPTLLVCSVKNISDADFQLYDFLTNGNGMFVTKPDGKLEIVMASSDPGRKIILKIGEEKSWQFEMDKLFTLFPSSKPGIYRMKWRIGDEESNELVIIHEEPPKLSLEISLSNNTPTPQLVCVAQNTGPDEIATTEFQTNQNGFCLLKPNGEIRKLFTEGEPTIIHIKRDKIMVWKVDLPTLLPANHFQTGWYKLFWQINEYRSNELPIYITE